MSEEEFFKIEKQLGISKVDDKQLKFARVFSSLFTLLFISTGLIYNCEVSERANERAKRVLLLASLRSSDRSLTNENVQKVVNPAFSDFFTTLYFGLCTLTTVGFGDIVPVTFEGRIVVCASILVGIGVIPLQVGDLAASFLESEKKDIVEEVIEAEKSLGRFGGGGGGLDEKTMVSGSVEELMREVETLELENKWMRNKIEDLERGSSREREK